MRRVIISHDVIISHERFKSLQRYLLQLRLLGRCGAVAELLGRVITRVDTHRVASASRSSNIDHGSTTRLIPPCILPIVHILRTTWQDTNISVQIVPRDIPRSRAAY
jgi:hypothetical protein